MVLATEHLGNHHVLKGMELNKHNAIVSLCYTYKQIQERGKATHEQMIRKDVIPQVPFIHPVKSMVKCSGLTNRTSYSSSNFVKKKTALIN